MASATKEEPHDNSLPFLLLIIEGSLDAPENRQHKWILVSVLEHFIQDTKRVRYDVIITLI